MTISKKLRITQSKDIQEILKMGRGMSAENFSLKLKKNDYNFTRIKVIVPVKVDKRATKRNLLRRKCSEILLNNIKNIKQGYDIVLILRKGALDLDFKELEEEICSLLHKSRLL